MIDRFVWLLVFVLVASLSGADDDETPITAGWDGNEAFIKSADGQFVLVFGGRVHLDFRTYSAAFAPPPTFLVRRARMELEGVVHRLFEFKIQADFADDESVLLRDGFVNVHPNDAVQVMAGQFKAPFSQEEWQSSKLMGFIERTMINNIVPGRSPGVMIHGHTAKRLFQYAASVQNDQGELGLNQNGGPDVFAQARLKPWSQGLLETVSFGGALGFGKRDDERFVTGRTSSRSIVFFDELPLHGNLVRRNVEGWWYPGPVLIQSEYDDLRAERHGLGEGGHDLADVEARGFMVQGMYVLTGETNDPDAPVEPRRPVHEGGPGAWEVGVRYQVFDIEGANRADELAFALNWWLNGFVRYQANVSREGFRNAPDPTTGETSNWSFLSRLNMYF